MLDWSIEQDKCPVAIRIPCNGVISDNRFIDKDYSVLNQYKVEETREENAIPVLGEFYQIGQELSKNSSPIQHQTNLINPRYITGLDIELLESLKENHSLILTLEDGILDSGFGQKFQVSIAQAKYKYLIMD